MCRAFQVNSVRSEQLAVGLSPCVAFCGSSFGSARILSNERFAARRRTLPRSESRRRPSCQLSVPTPLHLAKRRACPNDGVGQRFLFSRQLHRQTHTYARSPQEGHIMNRTRELGRTIGSLVGLAAASALVAGCGGSE